jgi:xanthine dehydrogenase accessory factor
MMDSNWSVPETAVVDTVRETLAADEPAVLATIVGVEGSAYRQPGAKMVVGADGDGVGSLTAGCLEDEVRTLAGEVLDAGEPRIEVFDLTGDDVWGLGVGCNGVIRMLLEPLDDSLQPALDAAAAGENCAVATVVESDHPGFDLGDRLCGREGRFIDTEGWLTALTERLSEPAATLSTAGKADTIDISLEAGSVRVFLDGIAAPPELLVFGTGHDVRPVVELATLADFHVTVVGFRGATATAERFPSADRVISTSPTAVREEIDIDERTYTVVMTHNFVDDRLTLAKLTQSATPYIGLMGPTDRFSEMLDAFEAEGQSFDRATLNRVYTPIGIDLGGGAPYQIATSIVSEVLAVHNERTPQHLSGKDGPIHERLDIDTAGE